MLYQDLPQEQRIPRWEIARWTPDWLERLDNPERFCPAAVQPFPDDQRYMICGVRTGGKLCTRHNSEHPRRPPPQHLTARRFAHQLLVARRRWQAVGADYAAAADAYQVRVLRQIVATLTPDPPAWTGC